MAGEGSNPEFRIADDARLAIEPLVDFVIGLTNAILAAVTFIGVLWVVGGSLDLRPFGVPFVLPGYMVVAVILYAALTSTGIVLVGRPLIRYVETKNTGEAKLRYELTRVRESAENIALIGGDDDERARLDGTFRSLAGRWVKVIVQQARMTWISNGNAVLSPVVPLLLGAPKYLSGEMSLGSLMQAAAAFAQVQMALNWLVDNAIRLAEWFASAQRVVELVDAVDELEDTIGRYGTDETVVLGKSPDDAIHIEHLSIKQQNGSLMIDGADAVIGAGREGAGQGRVRNRQEHAHPHDGGSLAMGIGQDPAAREGRDRLHAAAALHAARNAASRAPLSGRRSGGRRRDAPRCAPALRPHASRRAAGRGGPMGSRSSPAARSSGSPSPGSSSIRPTSSSWTSPPRRSTR